MIDDWIKEAWGDDATLMQQDISEVNRYPSFHKAASEKAALAYRIMKRFKEIRRYKN